MEAEKVSTWRVLLLAGKSGVGDTVGSGGRELVLSQVAMGGRWLVVGLLSLMRCK